MKLAFNTVEQMSEGEEHLWQIELDHLRAQVRFALEHLNSIDKRNDVKGKLEDVYFRLKDLCEATRGEKE